ncbi:MAG: FHA domain-containing protein [Polyangiales bacterium]
MNLTMTILSGPHAGHSVQVPMGTPRTFGRDAQADVVLSDPYLNDAHFAVYCEADGARLRDLASQNGTFVNDEPVQDHPLRDGDRVTAGQTLFRVDLSAGVGAHDPLDDDDLTVELIAAGMRQEPHDRARWALTAEELPLFAVVDVAKNPELLELLNESGDQFCAFDETQDPDALGPTAPFLTALTPSTPSFAALLDLTWGNGQAIFLTSRAPFMDLYAHLIAQVDWNDDGSLRHPGWWEPRELVELLAQTRGEHLAEFYGPIDALLAEGPDRKLMRRYTRAGDDVATEDIPLGG